MAPGVPFTFGSLLDSARRLSRVWRLRRGRSMSSIRLARRRTHGMTEGLNEHGPYTAVFEPSIHPGSVWCAKQSMKAQVEQFLHKFCSMA